MKILLISQLNGWFGLHVSHFIDALRKKNVEVIAYDYHRMERFLGFLKVPGEAERRNRLLEKAVRRHRPDAVFFVGQWKFDHAHLKSYFNGKIAVYDYDGPRRRNVDDYVSLLNGDVDVFFTVSRWLQKQLAGREKTAIYLPHGVNTDYYAPRAVSGRFVSDVSYVGRATPRRVEICSGLRDMGLALYGERWHKSPECRKAGLLDCIRLNRDVKDVELVDIYSSSKLVLNMLQENLNLYHTVLSIQSFAVPSAAGCLLTEYVEELPEAFEPGKEVLCFKSREEMIEQAAKCRMDQDFARKIGQAGRMRCLSEHQWSRRVDDLLKYF